MLYAVIAVALVLAAISFSFVTRRNAIRDAQPAKKKQASSDHIYKM